MIYYLERNSFREHLPVTCERSPLRVIDGGKGESRDLRKYIHTQWCGCGTSEQQLKCMRFAFYSHLIYIYIFFRV